MFWLWNCQVCLPCSMLISCFLCWYFISSVNLVWIYPDTKQKMICSRSVQTSVLAFIHVYFNNCVISFFFWNCCGPSFLVHPGRHKVIVRLSVQTWRCLLLSLDEQDSNSYVGKVNRMKIPCVCNRISVQSIDLSYRIKTWNVMLFPTVPSRFGHANQADQADHAESYCIVH